MNIKLPKSSTLLFVNILIFLFITLFAYFILQENIKLNNSKNQEILFFKIKDKSSALLTKVLQKYHNKKEFIKKKHQIALTLLEKGLDVTKGGAKYNLSGIQMIQVANLVDSLAAIKQLVYDDKMISQHDLLNALQEDFKGYEIMQTMLLNKVPKYGNDVKWVDELGNQWACYFREKMKRYTNYRGGPYHTGMYTVSAHVPMGENVGASPDGRNALKPLADGGMSPVYGRDLQGPTAVLKSVSKLNNSCTTNGGLLNMKFLPEFFKTETGCLKFENFLRAFVDLKVPHIQFNVVRKEDLLDAKVHPENHQSLTIRVAGYTAYFVELAGKLQDEIIERTTYENI